MGTNKALTNGMVPKLYSDGAELLRRRAQALANKAPVVFNVKPEDANWGHIGSLNHANALLNELLDFLNIKVE